MDPNILATDGLLIITSWKITQARLKGTVSSYSYNNSYLITFEKEDDNYHYEANASFYDIDETLLKDLITDLISKF